MIKKAFTLVEILVVISIIALLMGILLPSLSSAREQSRSIFCLNNLRQMAAAAHVYAGTNDGFYPISQYWIWNSEQKRNINYIWDFTTIYEPGKQTVKPGLLWQGQTIEKIKQCPSFKGHSSTAADPYTGYNYNVSYIGHGEGEAVELPVKMVKVARPAGCALFGDGQLKGGANKFMRSPLRHSGDRFNARDAGAQGYRHNARTNVAWCDGHASSQGQLYTTTEPEWCEENIKAYNQTEPKSKMGFLSPDNRAYDLN